jgi:hypothetical protein
MRPPFLLLLALLAACGGQKDVTDQDVFHRILSGELDAADGLTAIAHSGGLPVETPEGYLFARLDTGVGPYTLKSSSGSFPDTVLTTEAGIAWGVVPIAEPDGAVYAYTTSSGTPVPDDFGRRLIYVGTRDTYLVRSSADHLERWPRVGDAGAALRTLRVWVQPGATHFLYVHDGQNLFDPKASYGGWNLQGAAGPSTLVIGIDNTAVRMDEYTHVQDDISGGGTPQIVGGDAAAYADYVQLTVRPFIEARYGSPTRVGVMGSSLGGLVSYYEQLRYPTSYDFVASLSGTFGWGSIGLHNPTLIELYGQLSTCPAASLYLDSGGGPGSGCVDSDGDGIQDDTTSSSDNYCVTAQLKAVLEGLGCGDRVHYRWQAGAGHNESSWASRAPGIFVLFEAL